MDVIVDQLKKDMAVLAAPKAEDGAKNEGGSISLLGKWLPSENRKWDRAVAGHQRFSIALCKNLLGVRYVTGNELKKLRQDYVTPLRNRIKLVESDMSRNDFASIDYQQVPSIAMKRYRNAFYAKDKARFDNYISQVKAGTKKINADQVYPHELVARYLSGSGFKVDDVIEAQWRALREKVDQKGAFKNAISVVDVSGSMNGVPMQVAIALGILSANASNNNQVISFSNVPQLHKVDHTATLRKQVETMRRMGWGMNTDIEKSLICS